MNFIHRDRDIREQRIDLRTVDFSTRVHPGLACCAIVVTALSNAARFVAEPDPNPVVFVGVLTAMKTRSAIAIFCSTSVEKNKLGWRGGIGEILQDSTSWFSTSLVPSRVMRMIRSKPGSWTGRCFDFHFLIL